MALPACNTRRVYYCDIPEIHYKRFIAKTASFYGNYITLYLQCVYFELAVIVCVFIPFTLFDVTQPALMFIPFTLFDVTQPALMFDVTQPALMFDVTQPALMFDVTQPALMFDVTQPALMFDVTQPALMLVSFHHRLQMMLGWSAWIEVTCSGRAAL